MTRVQDVTDKAGLIAAVNSNTAAWADFDNDGMSISSSACEQQDSRLYRNKGDGTFEDVAAKAGVKGDPNRVCKGCNWIDYDNDGYPDLFLNNLGTRQAVPQQSRRHLHGGNDRNRDPWAEPRLFVLGWDYDNDGWLDIFATCYDRSLADVVNGMLGPAAQAVLKPPVPQPRRQGVRGRHAEAGLDMVFATMGSNFGDFDNDGFLDFYLGTGDPNLATLVPNRMFKNVGGKRFAEITGSSGTGHLQKGHGVACGDWDRDGDVDLFVEMGGTANGDKYHNVLFQNPGQGNHWLTVKLVGKKTNRSAIGARIKVVTGGEKPLTVYRHVSSGSSFGGNPLEQTIGLGQATQVARSKSIGPPAAQPRSFATSPPIRPSK